MKLILSYYLYQLMEWFYRNSDYIIEWVCSICGNNHLGSCATDETTFIWNIQNQYVPKTVLIAGSWKKWQTIDPLNLETRQNGEVFFRISLTLQPGTYEYKYIVDGDWRCDPESPTVEDEHGYVNNIVKVYPKKMLIPVNKQGDIRITSNLVIEGLTLIGSWDNWEKQIVMNKITNLLADRQELQAYVAVEPNKEYQFKFKLKKQFLIDEKYPTTVNEYNSQNNIIVTMSSAPQEIDQGSPKRDRTATPNKNLSAHIKNTRKDFACRSFNWVKVGRTFDLPYKRVEGHSMCAIGDYVYIFGGYCRSQYYNSLTKLNIQLTSARTQQALPQGRAFHNMVTYGTKIIVFGGHCSSILQNYYSFNVSEEKWVAIPQISGNFPQKVQKQSCVLYEMLMVFFGGYYCSSDFEYEACYNSISVLDIEYMRWVDQIKIFGDPPKGRFAHTATLIDSYMYIFGGIYDPAENLYLNDLWKIDLSKNNELTWQQIKPKGIKPCPRHGHTTNALHNYLVVFGGHNEKGDFLNDIHIFNTNDEEWFEPMISGDIPRPRYYHAAATIQHDEIMVFGGRTAVNKTQNLYILKPNEKFVGLNINEQDDEEGQS